MKLSRRGSVAVDVLLEWPGYTPEQLANTGDYVMQNIVIDSPAKLTNSTERLFPMRYYYDIAHKTWKLKATQQQPQ